MGALRQRAEAARARAQAEPVLAADLARDALAEALAAGDRAAAAISLHAMGLAARELHQLPEAARHLAAAARSFEALAEGAAAAEVRVQFSAVLLYQGQFDLALTELGRALPDLRGVGRARAHGQRGLTLQRLGRHDDALAAYSLAFRSFRRHPDPDTEARSLANRGVLLMDLGRPRAAIRDLERAVACFRHAGVAVGAAEALHNLAWARARDGDIPAALSLYDQSAAELEVLGVSRAAGLLDRCELLLSVRLVDEARELAARAVAELAQQGMEVDLADAFLLEARGALFAGAWADAAAQARRALELLDSQGRRRTSALAMHLELQARAADGGASAPVVADVVALGRRLERFGWQEPALENLLLQAAIGGPRRRAAALDRAAEGRHRGPAACRALGWYALGLRRADVGDVGGSRRALQRGLATLDAERSLLGSTELRASTAARGERLAAMGLGLAVDADDAAAFVEWSERWRAGSLRMLTVRQSASGELRNLLSELRRWAAEEWSAPHTSGARQAALRRVDLERRIRALSRRSTATPGPLARVRLGQVRQALRGATLVTYAVHHEEVMGVVVTRDRSRLFRVATAEALGDLVQRVRFGVNRLARPDDDAVARSAVAATTDATAARLDDLLFGPVRELVGMGPLVLVPTADLHSLPWSLLPTTRNRPFTVAPSVTLWLRALRTAPRRQDVVVVAGPGLPGATAEATEVAARWNGSTCLAGSDATTDGVLRALGSAGLVHLAAHGRYRADSPLFSSLRLADGELSLVEIEQLDSVAPEIVLSACDAGLSDVRPGDQVMGLVAGLLALGARTVVASVAAVGDAATVETMARLHSRLAAGVGPAVALADGAPTTFVCFGAGWSADDEAG